MDTTEKDFSAVLKLWQDVQSTELPALNRQLKSAGLAELPLASATRTSSLEEDSDIE